ncbi:hypothetical protein C1Y63_02300 [Corynebacterium sp. 13CS0277]|uniref:hypothetical protein n=1 Tax=Corynebacterium sp. 13CS0277 TaxID=2071994 RepID=UPI000D02E50E|nr:hypothetical protein [Corynebacterium sp. 13CS0277]PRQ12163.1 hypothetical protein C1Y63_02300 [Corynebacterium sp. 13CS0277]
MPASHFTKARNFSIALATAVAIAVPGAVAHAAEVVESPAVEQGISVATIAGSTESHIQKTVTLDGYTVKKTDGAPEVIDSNTGESVGFLPNRINVEGGQVYFDMDYEITSDNTVTATATRHGFTERLSWSCAAKNTGVATGAGAAGGTVLGLLGGPLAEITVPVGALSGAIEGFASGVGASLINC